jgi:hypothetical protein
MAGAGWTGLSARFCVGLCAVLFWMAEGVMTEGDYAAQAGSKPQRPAMELTCPDEGTALSDALCAAVLAELQGRAQAVPPLPLSVRLQISDRSDSHMTAHLEWQGQGGTDQRTGWTTGPDLTFSATDRSLSTAMMTRFARDLVRISGLPE